MTRGRKTHETDTLRQNALNALQAMRDQRLDREGGYPAVVDGCTIPSYVLIADADENDGPSLTIYRWRDVIRWYKVAVAFLKAHPEFAEEEASGWEKKNDCPSGIVSAMYETEGDVTEL